MSYYEKKRNGEDNRGNKTIAVRWNDNTRVIEASDIHGDNPVLKSTRYFRGEHRQTEIDAPSRIKNCNTYFGGVDRLDQNVSYCRISIQPKKW